MKLFFALCLLAYVAGDEYFYNMRTWVQPVFKQLFNRALYGMRSSTNLWHVLHTDDQSDLKKLDEEIRLKVAQHLQEEFGLILDKLQQLIDIVKSFALDMIDNFHVAANSKNHPEQVGEVYVKELTIRAKEAIRQIAKHLNYKPQPNVEEHLSGKTFQFLAVRIAREVLKGAELANIEISVLKQIEQVLNSVFDDQHQIETGIMSDVLADLHGTLRRLQPTFRGQEKVFGDWMKQLIRNGLKGAQPQLNLLHGYAKNVISEGCRLCQKVVQNAYQYFSRYRNDMGSTWQRIENIIQEIQNEETV